MRNRCLALIGLVWPLIFVQPVLAHEGHGDEAPAGQQVSATPRFAVETELYQLVGVVRETKLELFLDRLRDNAPVPDAALSVQVNGQQLSAQKREEGYFTLDLPALDHSAPVSLVVAVEAKDGADLILAELPALSHAGIAVSPAADFLGLSWVQWGALLTVAAFVGFVLRLFRQRRAARLPMTAGQPSAKIAAAAPSRRVASLLILGFLAPLFFSTLAFAHGDEDHGPGEAAKPATGVNVPLGDAPRRLAAGSLFVPKPTQRLLAVRTVTAQESEAVQTIELVGRLIADPNGGGRVQPTQSGRIEPVDGGLPYIGQKVMAGQILAYVAPSATTFERGSMQSQVAELNNAVALAERKYARLRQLEGSVPDRDIEAARLELEGLRQRRAALAPTLGAREPLRAPAEGIISAAHVQAGQVVDARETLFEIVDSRRFWVEAIAFEPEILSLIKAGTAVTANGKGYPLEFLGRSLALKQQSISLQFRLLESDETLSVGQPVRVVVQTPSRAKGILLPQASIVKGPSGQSVVWQQSAPERFEARPVRADSFDGERVLVSSGLAVGHRIVVQGAHLLSQIR